MVTLVLLISNHTWSHLSTSRLQNKPLLLSIFPEGFSIEGATQVLGMDEVMAKHALRNLSK